MRVAEASGSAWLPVAAQLAAAEPTRPTLSIELVIPPALVLTRHVGGIARRGLAFSLTAAIPENSLSALQITLPWFLLRGISLTGHAAPRGISVRSWPTGCT